MGIMLQVAHPIKHADSGIYRALNSFEYSSVMRFVQILSIHFSLLALQFAMHMTDYCARRRSVLTNCEVVNFRLLATHICFVFFASLPLFKTFAYLLTQHNNLLTLLSSPSF